MWIRLRVILVNIPERNAAGQLLAVWPRWAMRCATGWSAADLGLS